MIKIWATFFKFMFAVHEYLFHIKLLSCSIGLNITSELSYGGLVSAFINHLTRANQRLPLAQVIGCVIFNFFILEVIEMKLSWPFRYSVILRVFLAHDSFVEPPSWTQFYIEMIPLLLFVAVSTACIVTMVRLWLLQ